MYTNEYKVQLNNDHKNKYFVDYVFFYFSKKVIPKT
jgi:hypothetical protein